MSHHALAALGDSVEALLRREYQLADKTTDDVENIRSIEDDALADIEKQGPGLGKHQTSF